MRTFGLIGFPLEHSFSPQYFSEKFQREKITDARFISFPLASIEVFPKLTETNRSISGLAVTIPYKQSVIPFLDALDNEASAIGAVNCIRFNKGKTTGFNTDWKGFYASLKPLLQPHHTHALLLGSGGASKAVQYALARLGIEYRVVSRSLSAGAWGYPDLNEEIMKSYLLIVNCTPLGMYPHIHDSPKIPYHLLGENHLCFDLIYRPIETEFLRKAAAQHATIKNGMEMLEIQAELNWRIWNS